MVVIGKTDGIFMQQRCNGTAYSGLHNWSVYLFSVFKEAVKKESVSQIIQRCFFPSQCLEVEPTAVSVLSFYPPPSTHTRTQTHSDPRANFYEFTLGSEWKSTYSNTYRGRERATAAHSRKQTDREMSKSSQDESCMQIVLLTVSFPYSLTTLPQQRYRDRPRKTEGCGERGGAEKRRGRRE